MTEKTPPGEDEHPPTYQCPAVHADSGVRCDVKGHGLVDDDEVFSKRHDHGNPMEGVWWDGAVAFAVRGHR